MLIYSTYTNPYAANRSVFENYCDTTAERDYLRNDNANLQAANTMLQANNNSLLNSYNAMVAEANGMQKANMEIISRLNRTIISMRSERELSSRTFESDGYGNIWCIEPSKKKREVGSIKIKPLYRIAAEIDSVESYSLAVEYDTGTGD